MYLDPIWLENCHCKIPILKTIYFHINDDKTNFIDFLTVIHNFCLIHIKFEALNQVSDTGPLGLLFFFFNLWGFVLLRQDMDSLYRPIDL